MRTIWILFILLLCAPLAHACVTDRDCPAPRCLGASRICSADQCMQSPCLAYFNQRLEDTGSSYAPIEELEQKAPLSETLFNVLFDLISRWPLILGIMVFLYVIRLMYKNVGIGNRFLVMALFLLIIFFATYQFIFALFGVNEGSRVWDKLGPDDFHRSTSADISVPISREDLVNAAVGAIEGKQWYVSKGSKEYTLSVLKFGNRSDVTRWRFVQLGFTRVKGEGELVYRAKSGDASIYLFDEDRFVFILSGDQTLIDQELKSVVDHYPYRLDRWRSRLSLSGSTNPQFFDLEPADGSSTRSDTFRFSVSDDIAVDRSSIKVDGLGGFSPEVCTENDEYLTCEFKSSYVPGTNTFTLSARDTAGHLSEQSVEIFSDSGAPTIDFVEPGEGSTFNGSVMRFGIRDDFSLDVTSVHVNGIKGFDFGTKDCTIVEKNHALCQFVAQFEEGLNHATIVVSDEAGNTVEYPVSFTYLNQPRITVESPPAGTYTNNPVIIFVVADYTGIEHQSIIVSTTEDYEEVLPSCQLFGQGFEVKYKCIKQFPKKEGSTSLTITATDENGLVSKRLYTLYVDLRPPIFENVSSITAGNSVYLNFTVTDKESGISLDSLQFSGIDTLDIGMDCQKADERERVILCTMEFHNVPSGAQELVLSVNDKAANPSKKVVGVMI